VRRKLFPAKGLAVLALLVCIFAQQALALESFSIVVLPDTQRYSEYHPEIFTAQTRWIVQFAKQIVLFPRLFFLRKGFAGGFFSKLLM